MLNILRHGIYCGTEYIHSNLKYKTLKNQSRQFQQMFISQNTQGYFCYCTLDFI